MLGTKESAKNSKCHQHSADHPRHANDAVPATNVRRINSAARPYAQKIREFRKPLLLLTTVRHPLLVKREEKGSTCSLPLTKGSAAAGNANVINHTQKFLERLSNKNFTSSSSGERGMIYKRKNIPRPYVSPGSQRKSPSEGRRFPEWSSKALKKHVTMSGPDPHRISLR
jgi:hypothetical protein